MDHSDHVSRDHSQIADHDPQSDGPRASHPLRDPAAKSHVPTSKGWRTVKELLPIHVEEMYYIDTSTNTYLILHTLSRE